MPSIADTAAPPIPERAPVYAIPPLPWYRQRAAVVASRVFAVAAVAGLATWFFAVRPYVSCDDASVSATIARVAPEGAGGQVLRVDVEEGDRVTEGEPLVELDPSAAEADLELAAAQAALAAKNLKRGMELAAEHGISRRQLDTLEAQAQESDARLKLARIALSQRVLRAPFAGVVVQKAVDPGDRIETGQTAVSVADMEHAWVTANVQETDTGAVRPGQPVFIDVDEGGHFEGRVMEADQATLSTFAMIPTETSSGNFIKLVQRIPVKIALEPGVGAHLRVGQSVEVRIRVR